MAAVTPSFLLILTLLLLSPPPSNSIPISSYLTLISLSQSLTSRVATLRAARGDHAGAARAKALSKTLERGTSLGFYKFVWSVGWDFVRNYAWRDTMSFETLGGVVWDLNELLVCFTELTRLKTDSERAAWFGRNYKNALRVSKSLFDKLLGALRQSGPLREVVQALQKEVVEGDLLRDCLELGSDDLKGLFQILNDIALQYTPSSSKTEL